MKKLFFICLGLPFLVINMFALESRAEKSNTALKDSTKVLTYIWHGYRLAHDKPDSSMYFFSRALQISDSISYMDEKTNILNMMGNLMSRKGDMDSARKLYELNIPLFEEKNDIESAVMTYNNLGLLYRQLGNYDRALEYFFDGLKTAEEHNENSFLSNLYVNLGLVYSELLEDEKAFIYYRKSIKICESQNNTHSLPYVYNAIGGLFTYSGYSDSALIYYTKALAISREYNYTHPLIFVNRSIGELHLSQENTDSAYLYLIKSVRLAEKVKNNEEIMKSYNSLTRYYNWVGMYEESIELSMKSLALSQESQYADGIHLSSLYLYNSYEVLGNSDSALKYHKLYHIMSDSLLNKENVKSMTELSMKYEHEKEQREKEILQKAELKWQKMLRNFSFLAFILTALLLVFVYRVYRIKRKNNLILQNKNDQIEFQKQSLEESNRTKDKLFAIISHDLKGPFNSLIGFSTYLLKRHKENLDPQVEEYIGFINQASVSLHDLVDKLLHWSRAKSGKIELKPEIVNIRQQVQNAIDVLDLNIKKKKILIENNVDSQIDHMLDPNLFSFVMRNLLSNALKFSNTDSSIEINGYMQDEKLIVSVKDYGIGLSDEVKSKLFRDDIHHTTSGTDGEKGSGLGLVVCKEFLNMMGGTVQVESKPGKGSTFTIEIITALG